MRSREINWAALANTPKFVELHRKKKVFLLTWWLVGSFFFYLLPLCAGYFPEVMRVKVLGRLNFGFFFCLFEFALIWGIAFHYSRKSDAVFDPLTKEVVAEIRKEVD